MPTILVTGGARGIGRATAILAARSGWTVAINYSADDEAASDALSAVEAEGQRGVLVRGSVAKEREVISIFERLGSLIGPPDAVVINAGIVAPAMRLAEMGGDRIRRIFAVNTVGAILCAREAVRLMAASRGGRGGSIVFVSSRAAQLGSPFEYVDYAASKGALDTLTTGLAKELGPENIRVNAVRPGLIETGIHASGGRPNRAREFGAQTPLGRAGTPEEVANAVMWLVSPQASYTTGAIIDVAGGR